MSKTFGRRAIRSAGWVVVVAALVGVGVGVGVSGCARGKRLVEVFDNGPAGGGGPRGGSMGYRWVGVHDEPTAGNGWKTVDYDTLTPEQRKRIW